jgi:hypothetical protein
MEGGARHLYELRSYHLKPGTMVEWGNYWAKAIRLRDYKHTEAFLGTFSQVQICGMRKIIAELQNQGFSPFLIL